MRDVTGTGEVMKWRLREGQGEFPLDCPLHDTSVQLHYRVRAVRGGAAGPWLLDTRTREGCTDSSKGGAAPSPESGADAPPIELDTGMA